MARVWLTARQAAARAGIPQSSFRLLMKQGKVAFHRYGPRTIRIDQDYFDCWIAARRISATIDEAIAEQQAQAEA